MLGEYSPKLNRGLCIVLFLLSAFLLFFNLGKDAFIDYDEATYATVLRESILSENYITFSYLGEPWFDKPPLYFWLAGASVKLFGMNEFAERLPSAVAGLLLVILLYHTTLRLTKNPIAAFFAGAILTTNSSFIDAARQMRLDVPVTLCIVATIYCFLRRKDNARWLVGIGVAIGFGILMKSVIGFLAIPIICIISMFERDWSWLKQKWLWLGAVGFFLVVVPWHYASFSHFGPIFWQEYFGKHIMSRFNSNMLGGNITILDYVRNLFKLTEPWVLVFCGTLAWLILNFKKNKEALRLPLALSLSAIFIFCLFSMSRTKLFYYLMPLYPLWALAIGLSFNVYHRSLVEFEQKILVGFFAILTLVGLASGINFGWNVADTDYFRAFTEEEKKIGLLLDQNISTEKIYVHNHLYWETLRYYNGGRSLEVPSSGVPDEPFFIITDPRSVPTEIQKRMVTPMYTGKYLWLVNVESNFRN
ncbi:MAG TPA: glycosyltransferase family 39 protein [Candidatus Paceibacterota bacterium]